MPIEEPVVVNRACPVGCDGNTRLREEVEALRELCGVARIRLSSLGCDDDILLYDLQVARCGGVLPTGRTKEVKAQQDIKHIHDKCQKIMSYMERDDEC